MRLGRGATVDERVAHARVRSAHCLARFTRARVTLERSAWLVASSRAVLDRGRPPLQGGSEPLPRESTLRERLEMLIRGGVLPRIHASLLKAGRNRAQYQCTACGGATEPTEIVFEVAAAEGITVFAHRRCFDLWTRVAADLAGNLTR